MAEAVTAAARAVAAAEGGPPAEDGGLVPLIFPIRLKDTAVVRPDSVTLKLGPAVYRIFFRHAMLKAVGSRAARPVLPFGVLPTAHGWQRHTLQRKRGKLVRRLPTCIMEIRYLDNELKTSLVARLRRAFVGLLTNAL